ncbi:MAG: MBL fold metallo-hydrolase [Bacillota bacterium]
MRHTSYGCVTVLYGYPDSKFPRCTSLLVAGKYPALIDPGAGVEVLGHLASRVATLLNTHCHYDHLRYNYLFRHAELLTNPQEFKRTNSLEDLAGVLGVDRYFGPGAARSWARRAALGSLPPSPFSSAGRYEWGLSTGWASGEYPMDVEFSLGDTTVIMVHAPGHSAGFCCPYFPREGVVYTADFDLTAFGPWYATADGDPEEFAASARRIAGIDAKVFVTGHQEGAVGAAEFRRRLKGYLSVIDQRDDKVIRFLEDGLGPEEMACRGLVYALKYQERDPWVRMYERLMIDRHLERVARLRPDLLSQDALARMLKSHGDHGSNPWL